jgi:hypothetical protein
MQSIMHAQSGSASHCWTSSQQFIVMQSPHGSPGGSHWAPVVLVSEPSVALALASVPSVAVALASVPSVAVALASVPSVAVALALVVSSTLPLLVSVIVVLWLEADIELIVVIDALPVSVCVVPPVLPDESSSLPLPLSSSLAQPASVNASAVHGIHSFIEAMFGPPHASRSRGRCRVYPGSRCGGAATRSP